MKKQTAFELAPFLKAEGLPHSYAREIKRVHIPLARRVLESAAASGQKSFVVGLCGPQGSGKSTTTAVLKRLLEAAGLKVAAFSLDDFYLPRAKREELGREVHPLLQTRGVPGTHDVALGLKVLSALRKRAKVRIPSFDKATDDRRPKTAWPSVQAPVQIVLLEGWCVGAKAQSVQELKQPINELERMEDPQGRWRQYVNKSLRGAYRDWFDQLDFLVLLKAPGFNVVRRWRMQQEAKLRRKTLASGGDVSRVMNANQVGRFISHYERLTRHILQEMPQRADVVIRLDAQRRSRIG